MSTQDEVNRRWEERTKLSSVPEELRATVAKMARNRKRYGELGEERARLQKEFMRYV